MNTVAIIQARMGSERLPGKVLKKIGNETVLSHVINRVTKIKHIDNVVVATTKLKTDNKIEEYCTKSNINFFRGDSENVLKRYYEAAKYFSADIIIRITADCPLIDPELCYKTIKPILNNYYDYTSNIHPPSFPDGMDIEALTFETLKKTFNESTKNHQKEHVTPYIYENPTKFKIFNYESIIDLSKFRFVIDNEEDYKVMQKIYKLLGKHFYDINYKELVKYKLTNKNLINVNLTGKRNESYNPN